MKKVFFIALAAGLYACSSDPEPVVPPPAPVATAATFITEDHFTANWHDAAGATSYELEVATDKDFTAITNIEKGVVTGTIIWGTESMTQYFYRVKATISGGDPSPYSNIISLYTLPDPPVATAATNETSVGFTANWQQVPGITNYLLFISLDSFASDPLEFIAGYEGKDVTGTSFDVTGMDGKTLYYYALKAKGDESISFFSNAIIASTN